MNSSSTPDRQAAPGALEHVRQAVNSVDLETGADAWASPAELRRWLLERELIDPDAVIDDADRQRAIAVREALRALLLANNDPDEAAAPPAEALALLEREAVRAPLAVRFPGYATTALTPAPPASGGLEQALGRFFAIVHDATVDGSWARLKACRNDACRWAFYDRSRNRSGTWCSMAVCGNRMKARAYRARHADDEDTGEEPDADADA